LIKIAKDTVNAVYLTLTEKVTLSSPKFLFVFQNDITNVYYYFIAADTSSYTYRYNKFSIEEKEDGDPLLGEIELPETGFYNYTIYEQESSTNLDPDNATGIVEIGKVLVTDTETEANVYDGQTKTRKVYG
jgi:hypothetical protein